MTFDYQTKGCSARGARMGRASDLPNDCKGTLDIRRVHLDGDYDAGGAYWGGGQGTLPLFCVFDADNRVSYVRATDIDAAKATFPGATWIVATDVTDEDIADMLQGYIACAFWSSNDESDEDGGEPLDSNYNESNLADSAREAMKADVTAFARTHGALIASCIGHKQCDWAQAGHDLWLNRNGHGCGFWDGDWPKAQGKLLDKAAKKLGTADLYVGDDGKVYSS